MQPVNRVPTLRELALRVVLEKGIRRWYGRVVKPFVYHLDPQDMDVLISVINKKFKALDLCKIGDGTVLIVP